MYGVDKALEYVDGLEDEILNARLRSIMEGERPNNAVLSEIEQMRKSDGGFAFWDQDIGSITSTLNVIGWFDDLSLRNEPVVERTFEFLLDRQKEDGGWDEIEEVRTLNPPPFMMPNEINTRTWLTASCAHWLVRFGRVEPPEARCCPAEFLMQHIQSSGLIRGYLYASWDALVIFSYHIGAESEIFKRLLQGVKEKFAPDKFDGTDLAWLLRCLRDVNFDADHEFVVSALDSLEEKQEMDGSWSSADGPEYSSMTTVDVIRVLKDFRRLQ